MLRPAKSFMSFVIDMVHSPLVFDVEMTLSNVVRLVKNKTRTFIKSSRTTGLPMVFLDPEVREMVKSDAFNDGDRP